MLPKLAYLSDAQSPDRRGATRRTISLLSIPPGGGPIKRIVLLDISQTGLRFHALVTLDAGETVVVSLPHAGTVEAKVIWRHDDEYGAKFKSPVTSGAVSAAILASPPITASEVGAMPPLQPEPTPIPMVYVGIALWSLLLATAGFIGAIVFLPISGF